MGREKRKEKGQRGTSYTLKKEKEERCYDSIKGIQGGKEGEQLERGKNT